MDGLRHGGTQIVEHGSIEVLEWKRRWEMESDPGFQLTYALGLFSGLFEQDTGLEFQIAAFVILGEFRVSCLAFLNVLRKVGDRALLRP